MNYHKARTIDNFNRTVHINLSKIVRSYKILFDGLEPNEFKQRFKHEPQITLIVEVRAVHTNRFIVFNLKNYMPIVRTWIRSIEHGLLDEEFSRMPRHLITTLDDPELIQRKSIL